MAKNLTMAAMRAREAKALNVFDWALSPSNKNAKLKVQVAEFILKRIYPERLTVGGEGEDGEFVVTVKIDNGNNASPEPGNRISKFIQV